MAKLDFKTAEIRENEMNEKMKEKNECDNYEILFKWYLIGNRRPCCSVNHGSVILSVIAVVAYVSPRPPFSITVHH